MIGSGKIPDPGRSRAIWLLLGISVLCFLVGHSTPVSGETTAASDLDMKQIMAESRAWKPGDMEGAVAKVKPALVLVRHRTAKGEFYSGTGFFVSPDGLVFTCAHVVQSSYAGTPSEMSAKTWIRTAAGKSLEARTIYSDRETDFAVLLVDGQGYSCIGMNPYSPVLGQEIVVFGFAGGTTLGADPSLTKGIISSVRSSGKVLQIDAAVNPGCSGGPVVSSGGGVMGIAWARIPSMAGTNFAVARAAVPDVLDIASAVVFSGSAGKDERRLVNVTDSTGRSTLQYCVSQEWVDRVKLLLAKGADISYQAPGEFTPLHTAAYSKSTEIAGLLIEKGARLEARDCMGDTPLFTAVVMGDCSMVSFLISRGANVDAANDIGARPLHQCVWSKKTDIARELLKRGAQVNAMDDSGNTALHWAALCGERAMVDTLKEYGAVDRGVCTLEDLFKKTDKLLDVMTKAYSKRP